MPPALTPVADRLFLCDDDHLHVFFQHFIRRILLRQSTARLIWSTPTSSSTNQPLSPRIISAHSQHRASNWIDSIPLAYRTIRRITIHSFAGRSAHPSHHRWWFVPTTRQRAPQRGLLLRIYIRISRRIRSVNVQKGRYATFESGGDPELARSALVSVLSGSLPLSRQSQLFSLSVTFAHHFVARHRSRSERQEALAANLRHGQAVALLRRPSSRPAQSTLGFQG